MIFYTHLDCPLGSLLLTSDGGALTGLHLPPNDDEAIEVYRGTGRGDFARAGGGDCDG